MRIAKLFRPHRVHIAFRVLLAIVIAGGTLTIAPRGLLVAAGNEATTEDTSDGSFVATDRAVVKQNPANADAVDEELGAATDDTAQSIEQKPDVDPMVLPKVEVEAATFNGAQPGKTTAKELETLWGKPRESSDIDNETVQQQYSVPPFEQITVTLVNDELTTIMILLDKAFPPEPLANELQLSDITPVQVADEFGEPLGLAFPERGVIFTFAAGHKNRLVAQIILEQIDTQPFVLRAERHARARYRANLADLNFALSVDPDCVRATH